MEVIQFTYKSSDASSNITNTTSQTIQHVLIPSTSDTKDASTLGTATSATSLSDSSNESTTTFTIDSSQVSEHSSQSQQIVSKATEYSAQIPYNPARPPPYTYQRQHEFPPFPPLTRHPVLPFLTTAFADQDNRQSESSQPNKHRTPASTRPSTGQRNVQNHISTIPTMDVSKNDPTAIFIRPPFVVPPPSEDEEAALGSPPPGTPLTYAILHNHRNWFLDPDDFGKDNPNRIDYPPELEPPRGWAPLNECLNSGAVKKQKEKINTALRTKGSYVASELMGFIEYGPSEDCHELTVLRCTFCRREYHGPNAKSMWRRHVYDKHKVAMKNRREGSAGSAIRNMLKKPKSKGSSESPDMPAPNDAPPSPLDLASEQNIIRLLERVVSGDIHLNLPASILGSNTISLQTIASALQKSGITMSLHDNNLEIVPSSQSELGAGSQSTDYCETTDMIQDGSASDSSQNESCGIPKKCDQPESPRPLTRNADDTEKAKSTPPSERTPLKDNTFADRSHHNSAPGTPRKDKTKQLKIIPKSPMARLTQNTSMTPFLSPKNAFSSGSHHHRSLTSTALRARALATTGEESYLTFLASSPSTAANSPLKAFGYGASPNTIRLSPFYKIKHRESDSDDLVIPGIPSFRFPPLDLHVESSNNPTYNDTAPTSDPVEIDSKGSVSLSTDLAPPAQVDDKPTRFKSISRTSQGTTSDKRVNSDEQESKYSGSSPLRRLQRRRSNKNDDKDHEEDFDVDHFLDLNDSETPISNPPSSPQKIPPSCGFAKEFGLLSQEEVDRITGSIRPGSCEDWRNPKRRRIESPL